MGATPRWSRAFRAVVGLALGAGPLAACHEDPAQCCDLLTGCRPCPVPTPPPRTAYAIIGFPGSAGTWTQVGYVSTGTSTLVVVLVQNVGNVVTTRFSAGVASKTALAGFDFAGGRYPGTGGTCGSGLAPAETCRLVLSFSPSVPAQYLGSIRVAFAPPIDSSLAEDTAELVLDGTGFEGAIPLTFSPSTLDFGSGSTPRSAALTATNTTGSAQAVDCAAFAFPGGPGPAFSLDGGGCCAVGRLGAGESCGLNVKFAPATQGQFLARMTYAQPVVCNQPQLVGTSDP